MWLILYACAEPAPKDDSAADSTPPVDSDSTAPVDSDSGTESADPCAVAPTVEIRAPGDAEVALTGTEVVLDARSTWNTPTARLSWTVDGVEVWAHTLGGEDTGYAAATWTAAGVGEHTLVATLTDECDAVATDAVTLLVTAPTSTWDVYGAEWGLPVAAWYGLSVAADGTVWGATSAGLVRFEPDAGELHVYTAADGLTTDYPRAVLAASDGTVWVGHTNNDTRQGEQIQPQPDGTFTVIQPIDYTESSEITAIYRLREDPSNGDIWMGANEGINVYDADLGVFAEHAHPTHPHSNTYGVAFTSDSLQWNGDTYQVSRWNYSDDGDLNPSADLVDYWVPWPVTVKTPVYITDADGAGLEVWLTSSTYGVARITTPADGGTPATELLGAPFPASALAVRLDLSGRVWLGGADGLYLWDGVEMRVYTDDLPDVRVQQIAVDPSAGDVWVATSGGLVRITGTP